MAGPNDEYVFWLPPTKERPIGVGIPRADVQSPLAEDLSRGSAPMGQTDLTDALLEERGQQLYAESMPDARAADQENEAARNLALDEETEKQVRESGLVNDGPPQEQYDYRSLVEGGGNLKVGADGQGVDLPNQHWTPSAYGIAGIDVATGERVTNRWSDDEGFIQGGIDAIRVSTSNTVKGPPVEDIEPLANIAYGIQQEGGSMDDYKQALGAYHNDESIQRAWNATMRVRQRESLEAFAYDHGEEAADAMPERPLPELEPIMYDELVGHEEWMKAAQILWDELEGENPVVQGIEGEYFAEPEPRAPLEPGELSDWLITKMSNFNWNVTYMAYLTTKIMNGDERLAKAAFNAMTIYDNLESAPGQTGRALGYLMADPLTYVSFGAGSLAARAGAIPLKSVVARIAMGGAAGGALEGGLFMGLDDTLRQTVAIEAGEQEEFKPGQAAASTAMGVGLGATMGGTLAAAASKPARQLYMRAGRRIAENARSVRHVTPGTPQAQVGSIGDQAAGRAHARAEKARAKIANGERSKINDLDVVAMMETAGDNVDSPVSYGKALDHVRKTLKRKPSGDWEPKWAGTRLCDDQGCVELGLPTMEHWVTRVEEMLSPEEIAESARWYETIAEAFQAEFGEEADTVMIAWLMSNQNVDPAGALMNALRVREQVGSGAVGKLGGLSDAMVRKLFRGEIPQKGMGLKLHDFIDSALGKGRRTVANNVPELGAPAVVDVHTARDMGYVDPAYRNYLQERFGKEALEEAGIPTEWGTSDLDFGKEYIDTKTGKATASGGVRDTQYEHAADHMRALTDQLNAAGIFGGKLTPMQVQAIGWTAQARRTGSEAFNAMQSIQRNTRQLSYELVPGAATQFAMRFGARFDALDYQEKSRVTRKVTDLAMGTAMSIVRPHESIRFYGPGGWMDAPAMPSAHTKVVSTKEAAEDLADVMGYLLQQDAVMVSRPVAKKTGWKAGLDIIGQGLSNPERATEFWRKLQAASPALKELGFMPMREADGEGIRIVFTKGGDKYAAKLQEEFGEIIERIADEMDIDVKERVTKIEASFHGNNWADNAKGEEYLARLKGRYGSRIPRALEREHRRNVERVFDEEITKAEGRAAKGQE